MFRTFSLTLATLAAIGLAGAMAPVNAGGYSGHGGHSGGGYCPPKPPTPPVIHKSIRINNSVRINKQIWINRNINIHKNIVINKPIIINKGGSADAMAFASAAASARSDSTAIAVASGGTAIVDVEAPRGGDFGAVSVEAPCVDQWAIVVKAIHAECVGRTGNRHPATRMRPETWVDSSMNAEIFRCLAGSYLHVKIGDVVDSREGMAGVFEGAQSFDCAPGQALRHYRDGTVKCAVAERLHDCAERQNMRRYGLGDLFFSYRAKVCARVASGASATYSRASTAATSSSEVEVEGSFNGGVGN